MAKIFQKMLRLHWIFLYNLTVCSKYLTIIHKVTIYNNLFLAHPAIFVYLKD